MARPKMTLFAIGAERWPGISKLLEEAGEVIQVGGKLLATYGEASHWDGSNLRDRLTDELGDLLAAIDFVVMLCELDASRVMKQRAEKLNQFLVWHNRADSDLPNKS